MTELKRITKILCPACTKTYDINIENIDFDAIERFPFTILVMHTVNLGDKEVHALICYIDKQRVCRHVERLDSHRIFITPYILYNPDLLKVYRTERRGL